MLKSGSVKTNVETTTPTEERQRPETGPFNLWH